MATSLTGIGAVWATLSLLAAVLSCSGFYLPFWIQRLVMNETKQSNKSVEEGKENPDHLNSPKLISKAYVKEEVVVSDEPTDEEYFYMGERDSTAEELGNFTREDNGETMEEEGLSVNQDALLVAWWNYKKASKQKKKNKKLVEIYRDENCWTDDRYTDDEDFNYSDA